MKVISVAGYSKTGKTTVAVTLIAHLKKRGYRVAAIKDIHNEQFTMEREGSNSYLMQKAGAEAVFARGLKETYLIRPERMNLSEMINMLDCDWLVVEGMKKEALPKIITADSEEQLTELVDDTAIAVSGKISNKLKAYNHLQVINPLTDSVELLNLIEDKVFDVLPLAKKECCGDCGLSCYEMVGAILSGRKKREDCVLAQKRSISVRIEGKNVQMVPFVGKLFYDLIHSFLSNLKGYKKGKTEIEC